MEEDSSANKPESKDWAVKIEGALGVVISLAIIVCLAYAITTRGWQFFNLPLAVSTGFAVLSFILSVTSSAARGPALRLLSGVKAALGTILLGVVVLSIIFGVILSLKQLWGYASIHIASTYKIPLLVGLLTFIVGAVFFLVRTVWRVTYGLSEVIAGVCIASYRAFGAEDWFSSVNLDLYLVVLTAGVYLVVRGLDNIFQGLKQSNDPMVRAGRWLKSQIYVSDPEKIAKMYGEKRADE